LNEILGHVIHTQCRTYLWLPTNHRDPVSSVGGIDDKVARLVEKSEFRAQMDVGMAEPTP